MRAAFALLALLGPAAAAPADQVFQIAPASDIVATQVTGQAATPHSFVYELSVNKGKPPAWFIDAAPPWLCANATSGKTPYTLVFIVCGAQQPVGLHEGGVAIHSDIGAVHINARLTVTAAPVEPPIEPPVTEASYCMDDLMLDRLVTDEGDPLTCP